ncbi:MAG TPA: SDR family NAD(P)-dependent oxidoreductase [Rhodoglobus sp.]|nr:SDR family NAD(P)-dependent oxidoreductase [Rhodoglobus sp.]
MLIDLRDRVVVVSGGAGGIGRTLVERFLAEGARVASLDLQTDGVPDAALAVPCDVTDPESVGSAIATVVERYGTVDVLINNAGIIVEGPIEELTVERWRRCLDVNVTGVFLLSQAVIPVMKRAGRGRILNAASFAAIVPSIGSAAYAASKAAVVQFSRVLAGELGPWNITVNSYAPGMIPTGMNGFADMPQPAQDRLLDTLTLRRW